jgi:integrase
MPEGKMMEFIERANNHEFGAIYFVTLFTGMRQSEVLGLSWACVDFERGILLLRQQLIKSKERGGGYSLQSLKNDKPRTITPAPIVMQKLLERRREQARDRLAAWEP